MKTESTFQNQRQKNGIGPNFPFIFFHFMQGVEQVQCFKVKVLYGLI